MTEKEQNEACCEVLDLDGCEVSGDVIVRGWSYTKPLFTRDDNMARLLRNEIKARGGMVAIRYVDELLKLHGGSLSPHKMPRDAWAIDAFLLMQATPAQQVEAALRALGKWENSE